MVQPSSICRSGGRHSLASSFSRARRAAARISRRLSASASIKFSFRSTAMAAGGIGDLSPISPNDQGTIKLTSSSFNKGSSMGTARGSFRSPSLRRQLREDRYYAAHLLGDLKDPRAVPMLVPLLKDEEVNLIVPWSLGEIGDKSPIPPAAIAVERKENLIEA